jgi:RNA polymerase sigma factor (sigma-70 family)
MTPDSELLARFARTNAEDAFAELVKRHVNLVYSAALRQAAGDAHLAQDVAQTVFTDLARKAGALARRESLTGWLYTSAHFAAAKIIRTETRRRDREETFMREPANENVPEVGRVTPCAPDWETLRPALDAAMHELKEADREAVLLRYFENRPFAEVGAKLGLNENAARMRVERALEKLRTAFARRGVAATAALASVLSANAVSLAPAGLAATLTTASIVSAGTGTFTLLKIMTMTKLKLGISALVVASATTAFVMQHQTQEKLRADNAALTQQLAQLKTDNASLSNRLAAGDAKKLPDEQFNELLKLRGEVGMLRQQTIELGKFRQENRKLLSQVAAQSDPTNLVSAEDQFTLRQTHAVDGMTTLLNAIKNYAAKHNGQYPGSFDQLTASGDLDTTNFAGNLGLGDFEFAKDGTVDQQGNRVLLSIRVPLQRTERTSVMVLGGISDDGVTHTEMTNVSSE